MNRSLRLLATLALIFVAAASTAVAQAPMSAPAQTIPPAGAPPHRPTPTNLKVLPADTTGEQVHAIMHKWEDELGVECIYCHAKDPATGRSNFASDANPMKDRARTMMKMTHTINAEYLTQLTDPKPEHGVDCATCHRGMAKPAVFVPPPPPPPAPRQPRPAPVPTPPSN